MAISLSNFDCYLSIVGSPYDVLALFLLDYEKLSSQAISALKQVFVDEESYNNFSQLENQTIRHQLLSSALAAYFTLHRQAGSSSPQPASSSSIFHFFFSHVWL